MPKSKFENISVYNIAGAFRGLRNPMNSWDSSDSELEVNMYDVAEIDTDVSYFEIVEDAHLGEKDIDLAQRMIRGGNDESKFLRQIFVSMDITLPLSVWKELDTYKVATVANSCSTMHKLASTQITLDCFSFTPTGDALADSYFTDYVTKCEQVRQAYVKTKDVKYWRLLVDMLPESWLQKRTWTANYAVLRNIYFARRNHKMSEWHDFCKVIEDLPYAKELICYEAK